MTTDRYFDFDTAFENFDGCIVEYETRDIMPFGKYRGRPLAEVAGDHAYSR